MICQNSKGRELQKCKNEVVVEEDAYVVKNCIKYQNEDDEYIEADNATLHNPLYTIHCNLLAYGKSWT